VIPLRRAAARLALAVALLVAGVWGLLLLLVDPASQALGRPLASLAVADSRFVTVPFPGTDGITLHYLYRDASVPGLHRDASDPELHRDASIPGASAGAGPEADSGGTPTFLLLHGFTLNAFSWQAQVETLARHGRVIAPDQLPYGLSEKLVPGDWSAADPYARASAIELLHRLLDQLGVSRAIVIGHSSGGTLAIELALAAPQRVAGLVLVAPWVYATRPVLPAALAQSPPLRRASLLAARKLGRDMPLLDRSYADPSRILAERREQARVHVHTRDWDLAWAALLSRSLSSPISVADHIDAVRQPVLVVSGDRDRLVPFEDSERVARSLPDAAFRLLPGCGHAVHEECPARFNALLEDWMAGAFHGDFSLTVPGPASTMRAP
jgi:pimeloyl-ACP methyl ester carboxylesterase